MRHVMNPRLSMLGAAAIATAFVAVSEVAAADDAKLRLRQATEAELKAAELGTGGALVVESAPESLNRALRRGDLIAFANFHATLTLKDLADAVNAAAGKGVDLVFYRGGAPMVEAVPLTPAMMPPIEAASEEPKPPTKPTLPDKPAPPDRPTQPEKPKPPVKPPVGDLPKDPDFPDPPVAKAPGAVAITAGAIDGEMWNAKPEGGLPSVIEAGRIRMHAGGKTRGATAEWLDPIGGDFELRVRYVIDAWDREKLLHGGLGIRIESTGDWKGARIVMLDREARGKTDKIVATAGDGDDNRLAANAVGDSGELRLRRRGDKVAFAWRAGPDAAEWNEMGEVPLKLSPVVMLRLVTYKVGEGVLNVTITGFDLDVWVDEPGK